MNLRNNVVLATIGTLTPLIFFIGYIVIFSEYLHIGGYGLILMVLGGGLFVFYLVGLLESFNQNNISLLAYRSRIVHSQYGSYYFMKFKQKGGDCYHCYIYENKYWIFLSKVNKSAISFYGDLDSLNREVDQALLFHSKRKKDAVGNVLKEWDGITDGVTRREKTIDKVIK
jgi:hypothetical protein